MTGILDGEDLHFIFIVDRSGSMGGSRIEDAKSALKIFMRSLPVGCKFTIMSFGSNHSNMTLQGKDVIPYSDVTMNEAIEEIGTFSSNFGGTNILSPLSQAQ